MQVVVPQPFHQFTSRRVLTTGWLEGEKLSYIHTYTHIHTHMQVVVPQTFHQFTSRRVLTTGWLEGEKLSQSKADDVGSLVNVGVISYLKQLLDTGFFHADPREFGCLTLKSCLMSLVAS